MKVNIKLIVTVLLAFLLISGGMIIVYQLQKPPVNELIDQSIQKQENAVMNDSESNDPENETNAKDASLSNQMKGGFVESVIQAVDFFFPKKFAAVAIGDSLTKGVGDSTNQGGYIGIIDQAINRKEEIISFSNYGKTGNRTSQLLKRLDEDEISTAIRKAEIVLITIGANDIMQVAKENFTHLTYDLFANEKNHFEERLEKIFTKTNQLNPKAHIYIIGIYNPFEKYFGEIEELDEIVNDWNEASEKVTEKFANVTFIPVKDLFENTSKQLLSDDHFHPNYTGYKRMAERVLEFLTAAEKG